jgi:hypothetical protein
MEGLLFGLSAKSVDSKAPNGFILQKGSMYFTQRASVFPRHLKFSRMCLDLGRAAEEEQPKAASPREEHSLCLPTTLIA